MAILAGIDEAGYGPTLGPLVVSGVAFRLPDAMLNQCLWEVLSQSCTKQPRRAGRCLPVADSKKLYKPKSGIALLERTALVMLSLGGTPPDSFGALLGKMAPQAVEPFAAYPWYAQGALPLPLSPKIGDLPTRANAVRRDLAAHEIEFLGVFGEPLPEGHFNRVVRKTRNKSVVLSGLALSVVDRIVRLDRTERVRIRVDRLGGRTHYREPLAHAFPDGDLHIIEETDRRSAYRLTIKRRVVEIEFKTKGDDQHFSVALASIFSKYVRELSMHQFNAYWCRQQPGLQPTAGYYTDARRWLADADGTIRRLAVPSEELVRCR